MRQRGPKIAKQWVMFFGLMAVLNIVWFVILAALLEEIRRSPPLVVVLTVPYLVALVVIFVVFFRGIGNASAPPEYHEAQVIGLPATAKVLEIKQTRWHTKRTRNFRLQVTPRRWEYEMRVLISRSGFPDYEAEIAEYLDTKDVPKSGAVVAVKVHPQRPEVVVLARG